MQKLPMTVDALIEMLDTMYPNKHPSLDYTDRKVWFNAGQRSVVDKLKIMAERDDQNKLEQD